LARFLILLGLLLVALGLLWPLIQKSGLGRLPGDIVIRRDGFHVYLPLTTSLLISLLLTLIVWFFRK